MQKIKNFFENGRTMLEMLAVLAIIASVGIGISAGINHGLMLYRSSVLKTQLPQIQKVVENTYSFVSGNRKYAKVDYATQEQYEDMFGDIFGKNACTGNEGKKGCKTAAGHMQIFSILNGLGFKTRIYDMPRDICLELSDSIRSEGGALYAKGLIMSNPCNRDSKQTVEFASLPTDFSNMNETGKTCPGNQIYNPDAVGDESKCICLHPDAIGEECLLPENETHDNDNNSGVVSSDTTTTTTAVQYTSKDEDEASTVISTSLEHTAATNASIVYNSDTQATTSSATTLATETTTPYATESTSYVSETTTAGMTTQTPTIAPMTTATTAPLTTTDNGIANVGDGNTTAILAITTAEPTTTAGITTQTPTMAPTTTARPTTTQLPETTTAGITTQTPTMVPTTTARPTTTQLPETTTAGITTQTPTMAPTTTARPTTTQLPETTTAGITTQTPTMAPTTTARPTTTGATTTMTTEPTTPYATQPASYVPETTTATRTVTKTTTPMTETTTATPTTTATRTVTETTTPMTETTTATYMPESTTPPTTSAVPEQTYAPVHGGMQRQGTPTNEIVSGEAVIKLTDVSLNDFNVDVTCGLYMSGLSYTVGLGFSVSTTDGSQPTLSQVKAMDWSEIKQFCHNHIESEEWLRSIAYKPEGASDYVMIGDEKDVNYAGSYSEDPFVSYYLVKADVD